MCPHGAPDDSDVRVTAAAFRLTDLAELAVRLGSPVDFYQYGDVLLFDDFTYGLNKGYPVVSDSAEYVRVVNKPCKSGGSALTLHTQGVADCYARVLYGVQYPFLGGVGLKFSLNMYMLYGYFCWGMSIWDGSNLYQGRMRYSPDSKSLELYNSAGAYVVIDDNFDLLQSYYLFHNFKFIIDFEAKKYNKLLVNTHIYDLSAYPLYWFAVAKYQSITAELTLESSAYTTQTVTVDSVVITQNDLGIVA